MIVDKTRHPTEHLRTAEHLLLVLLMATEVDDVDAETCAFNTVVGQALSLVRSAAEKLEAEMPQPPPIDFSAPIDRMVPRDAA